MNDDDQMTANEATNCGRENFLILAPFRALTGKGRHAMQENNDVWSLHCEWYRQAPYSMTVDGVEYRSFVRHFWLNEECTTCITGDPRIGDLCVVQPTPLLPIEGEYKITTRDRETVA